MADNINVTPGTGKTVATDDVGGIQYQFVKPAFGTDGSATAVSSSDPLPVVLTGTQNTVGVNIGKVDGTIQVNVGRIDDSVAIKNGTLTNITNTVAVYFDRGDPGVKITSGTVTGITNSIGVNLGKVDGTIQVSVGKIDDIVAVKMSGTPGTVGVNIGKIDGTIQVKLDPGSYAFVNAFHTVGIFTVSGSTSGVSASGVNLIAPSSSYNFKIFAYSIQTTAVGSIVPRFVNGAGGGQTEFWRPLITAAASSSAPVGANLAVTPPGYLFATGTNTSLNLHLDTGALVHYSVSYIKESA